MKELRDTNISFDSVVGNHLITIFSSDKFATSFEGFFSLNGSKEMFFRGYIIDPIHLRFFLLRIET